MVSVDQLSTQLGDEIVILGLKDSVYYGLTNVGTRIWQLLQTPRAIDDLIDTIVGEYAVTRDAARTDITTLLTDLHGRGLIAITPPDRA